MSRIRLHWPLSTWNQAFKDLANPRKIMEEVENQGIEQEDAQGLASPETEAAQQVSQTEQPQEENRNDRNWRELRKSKEEWERKAKMQEELLQRVLTQTQHAPQAIPEQEEDIIQELSQQEYVAGEKVAKGFKKLEEKFERKVQEIEKRYASQQQNNLLTELKREFPDFDQVVNSESLTQLEETNPRLANAIASSKDPYMIAVQSYEYLKAKGISSNSTSSKRMKETENKLEQNKKTIQTPQAFDKRPMAQAFQMTDAMKKELAKEMYASAQQVGMGY